MHCFRWLCALHLAMLWKFTSACSIYGCEGCGTCFNPGGRRGVKCKGMGGQTGYYCPSDPDHATGGDVAFACMDWTFGSHAMQAAESAFSHRTGQNVYFGVGTYGTENDPQRGLAACYRLTVEGVDKDIVAQSINTGFDVAGKQFDLQIGAGGAGAYNTCAGSAGSMFPGGRDDWGCIYGGIDSKQACDRLPSHPTNAAAMISAGDSLQELCRYSFDAGVRLSGQSHAGGACKYNPTLLHVGRVRCPDELVNLTQVQRNDEVGLSYGTAGNVSDPGRVCRSQEPGATSRYCLTRMMDCRKPSGAFKDNVLPELMVPGRRVVQPCTDDGYTRIDVQCGCEGCYC